MPNIRGGPEVYKYKFYNARRQAYASSIIAAGSPGRVIKSTVLLQLKLENTLTRFGLLVAK